MRTLTRFAILLSLVAAPLFAQVKETVTVSVVEVPVKVVDRDGNPVRGLTAANFKIVDDGKERPVTSFDTIDFASVESLKATSPLNPAARRNFMLLFDLSYSQPKSVDRAKAAAREFVAKMAQKRDRIAVATIDADHGFKLVTAFTTDRALVNAAIANPGSLKANDPLQLSSVGLPETSEVHQTGVEGRDNAKAADAASNEMISRNNHADDQFNRAKIEKEINQLGDLSRSLRTVSGQKSVLFLSEGFDPRLVQGRGAGLNADQFKENTQIEHGEGYMVDTDNRYGSVSAMSIVDKMADLARRSDVVLYAVDIKGLRGTGDAEGGYELKSNEGLHLLANATGGVVFQNTNSLASDFEKAIKHQEVSYVLGFSAPTSKPGQFHKLSVKLVNAPGGARVTSRAGYYEAGGETQTERTLSNAEIVLNDIPQNDVHITTLATPFATAGATTQVVPVVIEVNGNDLLKAARNNIITTDIFVYAMDEEGLIRDSFTRRLPIDASKVNEKLKSTGLKYYNTLALPEGKYAIKSLVRVAENEARGFTRTDIVVPHAGDVALSPPVFTDYDWAKWVMVKDPNDKSKAPYPFEVSGEPFIPNALPTLKAGQPPRRFVVFVQNATPEELTVDTNPKAKMLAQLKGTGGSKFVFEVDGPVLGASTMNVTVKKKGTNAEQKSSVPILVQ